MSDNKPGSVTDGRVQESVDDVVKEPGLYKVLLLNDDYTTMDFVVEILIKIFNKEPREATRIMLNVHNKGKGICGIYTYDIAISKIKMVDDLAKSSDYPLKCTCEKT
jgi:ATP-dependent Clp protease adaptor protein ClpS